MMNTVYVHSEDNSEPSRHNYFDKLQRLIAEGTIDMSRSGFVHVAHDDWCNVYHGNFCNCDPDIWQDPEIFP